MSAAAPQDPLRATGQHLLLFDGVCGLCSRLVQFVLARDQRRVFAFSALQSETGRAILERLGGDPGALTTFYVVADHRTAEARLMSRSRAALFLARELGWPWKAAGLARVLPPALLDAAYNLVARHRYRVFGRYEQCLMPRPEDRDRFVG